MKSDRDIFWVVISICLSLSTPVLSQSSEIVEVLSKLSPNCRGGSSTDYRSSTLVSPKTGASFFVEGMLQRRPRKQAKPIPGGCFPIKSETPSVVLHFVTKSGTHHTIPLFRHRSTLAFNYVKPLSFSEDGRYLVLQIDRSNGIDLESEIEVIDTDRAFLPLHLDFCQEANFGESFAGFTNKNQGSFKCLSGKDDDREQWDFDRRMMLTNDSKFSLTKGLAD